MLVDYIDMSDYKKVLDIVSLVIVMIRVLKLDVVLPRQHGAKS